MKSNPYITNKELAEVCGITEDGVYQNTQKLKKNNRIRRIGGDKGGYWEVLENGTEQQQHTESGVKGGDISPSSRRWGLCSAKMVEKMVIGKS